MNRQSGCSKLAVHNLTMKIAFKGLGPGLAHPLPPDGFFPKSPSQNHGAISNWIFIGNSCQEIWPDYGKTLSGFVIGALPLTSKASQTTLFYHWGNRSPSNISWLKLWQTMIASLVDVTTVLRHKNKDSIEFIFAGIMRANRWDLQRHLSCCFLIVG